MYALHRSGNSKPRTLVDAFLHVHQQSNTNIDINEYSLISLISTTRLRLRPTKSKKEKLIFEYMMDLVIVQLPVRWLWCSVSALK